MEFSVGYKIVAYGIVPLMFLIGFFGNILSIAVLKKKSFKTSTSAYLLHMAIISLIFIIIYIPNIVKEFAYGGTDSYKWVMISYQCYFGFYFLQVLGQVGCWVTAAVAIERCIVVGLPLKSKIFCRRKIAWFVCGGITTVSLLLNIPSLFRCRPAIEPHRANPNKTTVGMTIVELPGFSIDKAEIANIFLTTVIPFIIVLVCNITLLILMIRRWRNTKQFAADGNAETTRSKAEAKQKRAITALVLTHTSVYLISHILGMYIYIRVGIQGMEYYYTAMDEDIGFYSNTLAMVFFCFSSILYLVISQLFREKAKNVILSVVQRSQTFSSSLMDSVRRTRSTRAESSHPASTITKSHGSSQEEATSKV